MNLNTARLLASGNIITPKGRIIWHALFKPGLAQGETDKDKAKYQCSLIFPKGSDFTVLRNEVQRIVDENLPPAKQRTTKFRLPWIETINQPKWIDYADEYPDMLRCNAKMRPDVVTPKGDRSITEEEEADELYRGRWARMSVQPFWYNANPAKKIPVPGISLGLQNVQLLDHDEVLAGGRVRGTSEFEAASDDALAGMDV